MMKFLTFTKTHCASLGTIKHFLLHLYNASFKNIIDRNPCMQLHIKIGWKIYSIGHAENRNWSGRTAETFKLFETILELIREDPWEAASALPILRSSIYKICKKLFIFSPTRWCEFINYCLQKVLNKYSSLCPASMVYRKIYFFVPYRFSDECFSQVTGMVSTQNTVIWYIENPRDYRRHEMRTKK